jgi:hypothetical protein
MAGVPISAFLKQAEQERAEEAEQARRSAVLEYQHARSPRTVHRPAASVEARRLAS